MRRWWRAAGASRCACGWSGVGWLLLLALLVLLSVATYNKAFDGHVTATIQAPRTGMQLNVGGDVRMNGAIVGRVSGVDATTDGAEVEVQLDGDDADRIPDTATARILPTTLFGQKYVELTSPADPGDGHVVDGTVLQGRAGLRAGRADPGARPPRGRPRLGAAAAAQLDAAGGGLRPRRPGWSRGRAHRRGRQLPLAAQPAGSRLRRGPRPPRGGHPPVRRRRTRPPRRAGRRDHDHGDDDRGHPLADVPARGDPGGRRPARTSWPRTAASCASPPRCPGRPWSCSRSTRRRSPA